MNKMADSDWMCSASQKSLAKNGSFLLISRTRPPQNLEGGRRRRSSQQAQAVTYSKRRGGGRGSKILHNREALKQMQSCVRFLVGNLFPGHDFYFNDGNKSSRLNRCLTRGGGLGAKHSSAIGILLHTIHTTRRRSELLSSALKLLADLVASAAAASRIVGGVAVHLRGLHPGVHVLPIEN